MKELNFNYIIANSLAMLSVMACLSCSDDLESKELKVYLAPSTGGNKLETAISHPTAEGKLVMKLPVRSTRELVADATIETTINESLVADYNEQNGTEYKLLPTSMATIFDKVNLKGGLYESEDSLGFVCPDVKNLEEPGYVLPITISRLSSADKGLAISNNLNTVYFVIAVKKYLMYNATEALGALKERAGWKVTGAGNIEYPGLLDGNTKTGLPDDGKQFTVTLDMGSVSTIKGLRLTPRTSNSYDLDAVSIEVSENGQEWRSLKDLMLSPAVSPKPGVVGYQHVGFYQTISARYLKIKAFRVTSTMTTAISEIDVLE